jgi:hypothetical protein
MHAMATGVAERSRRAVSLESGLTLKVTGPPTKCGPKIKACAGGSG